jgi:hypothetical protein
VSAEPLAWVPRPRSAAEQQAAQVDAEHALRDGLLRLSDALRVGPSTGQSRRRGPAAEPDHDRR